MRWAGHFWGLGLKLIFEVKLTQKMQAACRCADKNWQARTVNGLSVQEMELDSARAAVDSGAAACEPTTRGIGQDAVRVGELPVKSASDDPVAKRGRAERVARPQQTAGQDKLGTGAPQTNLLQLVRRYSGQADCLHQLQCS